MAPKRNSLGPSPARNFGELLTQLKPFAGTGVFTATERTELRRRQRELTRLAPRRKKTRHAA